MMWVLNWQLPGQKSSNHSSQGACTQLGLRVIAAPQLLCPVPGAAEQSGCLTLPAQAPRPRAASASQHEQAGEPGTPQILHICLTALPPHPGHSPLAVFLLLPQAVVQCPKKEWLGICSSSPTRNGFWAVRAAPGGHLDAVLWLGHLAPLGLRVRLLVHHRTQNSSWRRDPQRQAALLKAKAISGTRGTAVTPLLLLEALSNLCLRESHVLLCCLYKWELLPARENWEFFHGGIILGHFWVRFSLGSTLQARAEISPPSGQSWAEAKCVRKVFEVLEN